MFSLQKLEEKQPWCNVKINSTLWRQRVSRSPFGVRAKAKGTASAREALYVTPDPNPCPLRGLRAASSLPKGVTRKGSEEGVQSLKVNPAFNFNNDSSSYPEGVQSSLSFKQGKQGGLSEPSPPTGERGKVVSITYEEIGLFPRSFSRVLDRFLKQVFSDVENLVIQEYRFYRYLFLTTLKCLFIFIFVPVFINFLAKTYVVRPLTEYFWNTKQTEIFLNYYQQKRAFAQLKDFEEKIYFESLVYPNSTFSFHSQNQTQNQNNPFPKPPLTPTEAGLPVTPNTPKPSFFTPLPSPSSALPVTPDPLYPFGVRSSPLPRRGKGVKKGSEEGGQSRRRGGEGDLEAESLINSYNLKSSLFVYQTKEADKNIQQRYQEKTIELALYYNDESIEAITNFFADFVSLCSLFYLFYALEIQINITKSFLLEVFFGLDDSKKSLLILLVTDLLVGYHSSNLWELFFESFFHHYGLPESQTGIFLLVATLPVLLDVLFKYLIFRHLNRSSPATVATYHAMIE